MKARHILVSAALAASVALTFVGLIKGAAILVGLATVIELVASALQGKKTNT